MQDHTISVNRQVTTDRGWKAVDDFYALGYYGISNPAGVWSDGDTLWVANNGRTTVAGGVVINKLYAFNVATKQRDQGKDFNTLNDAGNAKPWGIWSDGETMWVADFAEDQIFAYDMATKARDTSKEFNTLEDAGNTVPTDIWSDGETMWVVNGDPADYKIYAYDMATKARDSDKDFDTLVTANNSPTALWSDGTTMWISDLDLSSMYAYKMSDKSRDSGKDITIQATGSNAVGRIASNSAWSDGATLWVSDGGDSEITSFNMTAPAAPRDLVVDDAAHRYIDISWDKSLISTVTKYQYRISADDKATWLLDWADVPESDGNTTGYRIQGLSGNTGYVIQLRAVTSRGGGVAAEVKTATSETANTDARASSFIMDGIPIHRWNPDAQAHYHGVGSTVSQIAIEITMVDPRSQGASIRTPGDADPHTDGYQIDIQPGVNEVRFFTTSESGSQHRTYHVWINRGVDTDFGLNGAGDFHNLGSREDIEPTGIWSDGETMWLVDQEGDKVHAYNMTTKVRDPDKDFDTLSDAGNIHADGIWSDGETMWVGDLNGRVFAYDMTTKARDTTQEFLVNQSDPSGGAARINGLWSDGETVWAVDATEGYISALKLSDKSREPHKDFDLRGVLYARDADIWSDGSTMWVGGNFRRSMCVTTDYVFAYSMRTKERDTTKDFVPDDMFGVDEQASSLWSDGTTMWSTPAKHNNEIYAIYSYNKPASSDVRLKRLGVDDRAVTAFTPSHRTYQHGVEHTVAQATIVTETQNRYASVSYGEDDADPDTDGHQVDLSTGQNEVEITVTAQNGDVRTYTLSVNRGSDAAWGWKAVDDFDNVLSLTGATQAQDIWSNGETMWVANAAEGGGVFAYDMTTKTRDSAKDVDTFASEGFIPHEIWSDGETMWARPNAYDRLYGYNLGTGARDSNKDITPQDLSANHEIQTYYSDGNTLWVHSQQALPDAPGREGAFLYAYNWPDLSRRPDKDFTKLHETPTNVTSIWSDGTTVWILNVESHFLAFDVRGKAQDSSKSFGRTLTTGDIQRILGIWSDGETMWAVDDRTDKIYSFNMPPPSDDTSLDILTVNGDDVNGLDPRFTTYQHGVASTVTQATVIARPINAFATLEFSGADADPDTDGFQVDLSDGANEVRFTVTAHNGDENSYRLSVNRGVTTDFGWRAVDDLDGVMRAAGNERPLGIWGNDSTFWVVDNGDGNLHAYNQQSMTRDPDKDFKTLFDAGNTYAYGLWSDSTTIWVSDRIDNKLYAYSMSTKARDEDKDFGPLSSGNNISAAGIWSDGETMWVVNTDDDELYAYDMATKARDGDKDFDTLSAAGNNNPLGIWSNGQTMWVADSIDSKLYAYSISTKARDAGKDFDTLYDAGNIAIDGIWSNHAAMWVVDSSNHKLYSYNMDRPAPRNLAAEPTDGGVIITWDAAQDATLVGYQFLVLSDANTALPLDWTNLPGATAETTGQSILSLTNGAEYTFRLRGVYSRGGENVPGNYAEVTFIPRGALQAPFKLRAADAGDGAIALTWLDPKDATITKYQYRYKNASDAGWNPDWTDVADSSATTASHTLSGLTNYTVYTFEVRSYRGDEDSFSPEAQVSATPRGPLTAPTGLTASDGEDQRSVLGWDAAIDDSIANYQYRASHDGGNTWDPDWTDAPGTGWSSTSYTVTGLTNLILYTLEVRTARSGSEIGPAARTTATPEGPPTVPGAPTIKDLVTGDGELRLVWNAPLEDRRAPITSYTVRHRPENSDSWTTVTDHNHPEHSSTKHITIDELVNRQHYDLQVAAVNRLGVSPYASTLGTPQPTPVPPPAPPDGDTEAENLNLGPLTAFWTNAYGSDAPHADTDMNTLRSTCHGMESFKTYWREPEDQPDADDNNVAEQYQAHITTRGGAGQVTHRFNYEFGGNQSYAMYGEVSLRGSSNLSVQIRGRYSDDEWGTWSKPVTLICRQEE